jgi:hypothetical protein
MTTHAQLQAMMGKNPLLGAIASGRRFERQVCGLEDAAALTPQQSAALMNIANKYVAWKQQITDIADSGDVDSAVGRQLKTLVGYATRAFNRLVGGELDQGNVLQRDMATTMEFARGELDQSAIPSLQELYESVGSSIAVLVVSVARTGGAAAGALVKAAADELGIEPQDALVTTGKVAIAVGLVAGAVALTQVRSILGMFKRSRK